MIEKTNWEDIIGIEAIIGKLIQNQETIIEYINTREAQEQAQAQVDKFIQPC